MANGGMKNTKLTGYTDGPLKVVPYKNAIDGVKGCGKAYPNTKEGLNPAKARVQNYRPEEVKDHTGSHGSKNPTPKIAPSMGVGDVIGNKAEKRNISTYRQDHKGKY